MLPSSSCPRLNNVRPAKFSQRYITMWHPIVDLIWRLYSAKVDVIWYVTCTPICDAIIITFIRVPDFSCIISCHQLTTARCYSKQGSLCVAQERAIFLQTYTYDVSDIFLQSIIWNRFFSDGKRTPSYFWEGNINSDLVEEFVREEKSRGISVTLRNTRTVWIIVN